MGHPDYLANAALGFRIAAFALGVAVIIDAMATPTHVVQWVAGLVLVGIVPPDGALRALVERRRQRGS